MKLSTIGLVGAAILLASCDTTKELDRDKARLLLSAHVKTHPTSRMFLRENTLNEAYSKGILSLNTMSNGYSFTEDGKKLFESLRPQPWIFGYRKDFDYEVRIENPIPLKVNEVTGIRLSGTTAEVDYTVEYQFPSELPDNLKQYIYSIETRTAALQLYDDGWRVAR